MEIESVRKEGAEGKGTSRQVDLSGSAFVNVVICENWTIYKVFAEGR